MVIFIILFAAGMVGITLFAFVLCGMAGIVGRLSAR